MYISTFERTGKFIKFINVKILFKYESRKLYIFYNTFKQMLLFIDIYKIKQFF